jgi:hypothetical protein
MDAENLSAKNIDFMMDFYHLLRNELGFQHSRVSRLLVPLFWCDREGLSICIWF